jgi:hypothetical protein
VEGAEDQVAADPLSRPVVGAAAEDLRDRARDGQQDAAGTRGDADHRRRDDQFRDRQPITEADRSPAHPAHEEQPDTAPEPGLDHPAGDEEGKQHQPNKVGARRLHDVVKANHVGERTDGRAEDRDRRHRQGRGDDAGDGRDEDGEHVPGLERQAGRRRDEPQHQADRHRHEILPQGAGRHGCGRRTPAGRALCSHDVFPSSTGRRRCCRSHP